MKNMIINITDVMEEKGADFYNGGWIKKLVGIDDTKEGGYKYQGEFVPGRALRGLYEFEEGIYIVCSIEGSRRHQKKYVWLIEINEQGVKFLHEKVFIGNDWSLQLLPLAKEVLMFEEGNKQNQLAKFSHEQLIDELKRRGFEVTALRSII